MEKSLSSSQVIELRTGDIVSIRTYLLKDLEKGMRVYSKDQKVVEVLKEARDRVQTFLKSKEEGLREKERKSTDKRSKGNEETDAEKAFRLENDLMTLVSQVNLLLNKLGKTSIEQALE